MRVEIKWLMCLKTDFYFHSKWKQINLIAMLFLMIPIQAVSLAFHLPWTTQQKKAKKPLDYICQMEWLFFQTCQKYFINPCFSLQLICIPVCSCQWLIGDQLDLISFPAPMFGFSSFPSLRIFAVTFPPAGVLLFCFTLSFISFCNLNIYCWLLSGLGSVCAMLQMAPSCKMTKNWLDYYMVWFCHMWVVSNIAADA